MIAMLPLALPLLDRFGAAAVPPPPPPCIARQLALSADGRDGRFDGMQQSGTELSLRNLGSDCVLPALPRIEMLDRQGHVLAVVRAVPVGMHPGPAVPPVRLGGGHRAATELRWITGPVYPRNTALGVAQGRVRIGGNGSVRAPLAAVVDTRPGRPGAFDQPPLRAVEGMGAG